MSISLKEDRIRFGAKRDLDSLSRIPAVNTAFVDNRASNTVSVVDILTASVSATVAVGTSPVVVVLE